VRVALGSDQYWQGDMQLVEIILEVDTMPMKIIRGDEREGGCRGENCLRAESDVWIGPIFCSLKCGTASPTQGRFPRLP
jgi:hypothetical protein